MADNRAKISLILGSHAHIPHGVPEHEFERVCETVLKPFIWNLCKYPRIQAALHYSGVLLYWMERAHPELFMLIEEMVSRKQAELLGGGFYEPMLPLLSLQDKIGQIELLTTYLRRQFGRRPQGCWIPALAWEQNLIGPLAACGMAYTFLGEEQFINAGIETHDIYSPCISEDQGKIVTVFPIFRSIEKKLAEKNAQAFFGELWESLPEGIAPVISVFPQKIFSSAEEAPDYSWNRFFEEISLSESIVECAGPTKVLKGLRGLKKTCFSGSPEISPRRFLIAHPEANGIYSKMIFTSLLINQLRGDKSRKQNARQELWKAQGCDLFSSQEHLYCHSLRKAAYRSLLNAEQITREKAKFVPMIQFDFDFDGAQEFLFQDQKLNCYIQTLGAGIFELDYMPKAWNYLDTCNNYASAIVSQKANTPPKLIAFVDNFLTLNTGCGELLNDDFAGLRRCAEKQYSVKELDRVRGKVSFSLPPEEGPPFGNIGITKTFSLKKDTLSVSYILHNHGGRADFQFAPQIDLCFYGEGESFVRIYSYKTGAKDTPVSEPACGVEGLKIQDIKNEALITFASTNSFDARIMPRRVDYAELYQSTAIIPSFALSLEAGESWANEFSLKFAH
jgi:hypothetical protein